MKKRQLLTDALIGAAGYPMLEICWRGRTHASMALAGAASLLALRRISKTKLCLPMQALAGGISITAVELGLGAVFNKQHQVWDYRKMPAQLHGQICLPYSLLWCAISLIVLTAMKNQPE